MDTRMTGELIARWAKLGNPPCDHEQMMDEVTMQGYHTGDQVCTQCGHAMSWSEAETYRKNLRAERRINRESMGEDLQWDTLDTA